MAVSPDMANWSDYSELMENIPDFDVAGNELLWSTQGISFAPNTTSMENSGSLVDSTNHKDSGSKKRGRSESSSTTTTKACREKMRRDRLNDKFLELGSILEPGNPKTDKAAILSDAVRMVNQLRAEASKLKDSNEGLQEKIQELKTEKNELRSEKQRLKQEKENLEHQIKFLNAPQPTFMPPPVMPTAFAAPQSQAGQPKMMMPVIGYHGYQMWQFMPPADVDSSHDTELFAPTA